MDELVRKLRIHGGHELPLTIWEFGFSIGLCVCLLSVICLVYRKTHGGTEYSQSYVQTLMLTGMVTSLIMIIIGSNIARAFSLVGALSIIRFRNAIKETRDMGYIFFAMAIAMACGTQFYKIAIFATAIICTMMIVLSKMNFAAILKNPERLLKVHFPFESQPEALVESTFVELFEDFSLVSIESVKQGEFLEALFSVRPNQDVTAHKVIESITKINGNLKVAYDSPEEV